LAQGRLCEVVLRNVKAERAVYLLIHRDKYRTPALRAFQALLPTLSIVPPVAPTATQTDTGHTLARL
jgi:hypothetical protein